MNARHLTLNLVLATVAAGFSLGAQADASVAPDGWKDLGSGHFVYVGTPGAVGKTRAEVQAELQAFKRNPVTADGYVQIGDGLTYVGLPAGTPGKTRAQVLAELEAFQRNPVAADGWKDIGAGHYVFVGVPAAAEQRAEGNGATQVR